MHTLSGGRWRGSRWRHIHTYTIDLPGNCRRSAKSKSKYAYIYLCFPPLCPNAPTVRIDQAPNTWIRKTYRCDFECAITKTTKGWKRKNCLWIIHVHQICFCVVSRFSTSSRFSAIHVCVCAPIPIAVRCWAHFVLHVHSLIVLHLPHDFIFVMNKYNKSHRMQSHNMRGVRVHYFRIRFGYG